MKTEAPIVWGINKYGQEVKQHDQIICTNGRHNWITHVVIDDGRGSWHREQDYFYGMVVGSYLLGANDDISELLLRVEGLKEELIKYIGVHKDDK